MWDVIVVGARCAGAATAMLLARRGQRVLLVDRAKFPSETMSTLYIHQPGVALLRRWEVLDAVIASGCPPITTATHQVEDVRLQGAITALGEVDATYAPRRRVLDQILVEAAVDAGVEFAPGCLLVGVEFDGGRVSGARLRTATGSLVTERANLVIGADGMSSKLAAAVGARTVVEDPRLTCTYYTGWTGLAAEFTVREGRGSWIATVPTHDGVTLVVTYFPQDRFSEIRTDPLTAHRAAVRALAPDLDECMADGEQVDRLVGTANQRNFFRQAHGPGWALVGDAGHHRDSITARGITNAFRQAELLDDELPGDLADESGLDAALSRFAGRRDRALMDCYRSTLGSARLQVDPLRLRMLRTISAMPEQTARFFALSAGLMSMDDFLTAELIASVAAGPRDRELAPQLS
jgi:flavin-dependent dehydrogenase